jgi:pimeloyl-ACP methyl ester carboxylesterase
MSYGGWIATQFAAAHPDRLSSLVLLEPAIGTITMARVLKQGMKVAATQLLPAQVKRWAARRIDAEALIYDPRLRQTPTLAFRKFDRRLPVYAKLEDPTPDAILSAIEAPTLLVLGGRSELHDVAKVAERAQRLIRDLELRIIEGASHAVAVTRPGPVAERLTSFLARHDHSAPQPDQPTT